MPNSRVIPKRLPVCPGRDSHFTIRHNTSGDWWVYYDSPDGTLVPADAAHQELISLVNALKEAEGIAAGGGFSINEHFQVIARMKAPAPQKSIHVVDVSMGSVQKYSQTITFQGGAIDPTATPGEGNPWPGPCCGSTYTFAASGNRTLPPHNLDEVRTKIEGQVDFLSTHVSTPYPPATGLLAVFLAALRRLLPQGGRFRVNEHGRAFTSDQNLFIGTVPLASWFPPL